jgi:hypothetical protein
LKENNSQSRLLFLTKLSFIIEGEKNFHHKQKGRYSCVPSQQQKILKGIQHRDKENRCSQKIQGRINPSIQVDMVDVFSIQE